MTNFNCRISVLLLAFALVLPVTARADDTATIKGTIKFDGAAPKMKKIKMDAETSCKATHEKAGDTPREETVVVNPNNTLRWVVVWLKSGSGIDGKTFPVPADPVKLDQHGCQYHPHVWGMMAGQKLAITNTDEGVLHNIHAFSDKGNGFNKGMPGAPGLKIEQEFKDVETPVKIKCDVHGWMTSFAMVLPHPFFATSDEQGAFEIKGVPAGDYVVQAWHEKYPAVEEKVTVKAGETVTHDFTFKGDPADAPAK